MQRVLKVRRVPLRCGRVRTGFWGGCFRFLGLFAALASIYACGGTCPSPRESTAPKPEAVKERPSWSLITSGVYRTLAVSDLNGDGRPDVVGGSTTPGGVGIWLAKEPAHWSLPSFLPLKGNVLSVTVADFNQDGRPDVAFSSIKETQGVRMWLNQGEGKWTEGKSAMEGGTFNAVCSADLNKDGIPDLLAAAAGLEGLSGIKAWLADGKGGWSEEVGPTSTGQYYDVAVGDFNEDGCPDIVATGYGVNGAIRVWFGNCRGGWSDPLELEKGNFYRVTITDVNHDGHQDILAGTYRSGIRIYVGDGRGEFVAIDTPVKTGNFWKVVSKNSDGVDEILASSLDDKGILALEWKDGQYKPAESPYTLKGNYFDLLVSDLEGNGRKDLIASSDGEGIRVWPSKKTRVNPLGTFPMPSAETAALSQEALSKTIVAENQTFKTVNGVPLYRVGPGDVLEITVWKGTEQKTYPIVVGADGRISFSFVQNALVQGLTFMEITDLLKKDLSQYVREPMVEVRVKEFHSKNFMILGAINMNPNRLSGPGTYTINGRTTILGAISQAGGPTANANLAQVQLRRKDGSTFMVDLYKTIARGDLSQDMVIDNGDTILVPEQAMAENKIFVLGEVKSPGVFPLHGEPSLIEAVALAGGYLDSAVLSDTVIVRGDLNKPQIITRDLSKLLKKGDMSQNVRLQAGDVIYLPRTALASINAFLREIVPILQAIVLPVQFQNLAF